MIDMNEVRLDSIDPSPKGGQHVDNQRIAVKATHVPTGLEALCNMERSQYRNREVALKMLEAGLHHMKVLSGDIPGDTRNDRVYALRELLLKYGITLHGEAIESYGMLAETIVDMLGNQGKKED